MYHTLQEVFVAQYDGNIAPHLVAVVLLEPGVYVSGLDVLCWCRYVGDILVLRHVVVDVFLRIAYGDSTKEQIIVPMIEVKGEWKMR